MDKNYVHVGNIIEQERVRRQAQISKSIINEVYDHIEKAHNDDLNYNIEKSDNLMRFETDIQDLNKAETELLLHKIQRQLNADSESTLLKAMKSIAINHYNDIEKAGHGIYEDNAENRRLNRVGQEYGHAAEQKEPTNKQPKNQEEAGGGLQAHAAKASDEALKRAAADEKADKSVREAAKAELAKRNGGKKDDGSGKTFEGKVDSKKSIDSKSDSKSFESRMKNANWTDIRNNTSSKDLRKMMEEYREWKDNVDWDNIKDKDKKIYEKYHDDLSSCYWRTLGAEQNAKRKQIRDKKRQDLYGDVDKIDPSAEDSKIKVRSKRLNHNFIESLKNRKKFAFEILSALRKDISDKDFVSAVYPSDDGSKLEIEYKTDAHTPEKVSIPFNSRDIKPLNEAYKDYSEKIENILSNDNPEKMNSKDLNNAIETEMDSFWDNNKNAHNDSPEWREGAYQIYKKYNKNNPMSVEKFDRWFASPYQGASQGLKMEYYFNARENGADGNEADDYANTQYKAYMRQLDDPKMRYANFTPTPFSK